MEQILIAGAWRTSTNAVGSLQATSPVSGEAIGPRFPRSGVDDIALAVASAAQAADVLAVTEPARIAAFLDAYADAIAAAKASLVAIAHAETGLPVSPRLADVELPRTSSQLRQAAQAVRSYAWTHPVLDTQAGLRAHFAPLQKPVLVFGPNNFPLAFNAISGSDFASAIAARNPVIAKAHPSHPSTSKLLAELAHAAAVDCGLPAASVQMLYDFPPELGLRMAGDRRIGAIGFTGSRRAGLALKVAADAAGIPIYAEMSSANPVFLLPGALRERGAVLADAFFASSTMGSGQFCTNPGIILLPAGPEGDAFVAGVAEKFSAVAPMLLFSQGVQMHLHDAVRDLCNAGAEVVVGSIATSGPGWRYSPVLLEASMAAFLANPQALQQEAFGPVALMIRYRGLDEAVAAASVFDGNLTGSLHSATDGSDDGGYRRIASVLRPRVGRLLNDKWPTGVAVSAAMQHGGPYPSTSHAGFTAVGMPTAIHRFAQWQSYDNVRDAHLPEELRDANPAGIQRLIDGEWCRRDV